VRSHRLVAQNRERQRSFTRIPRYTVKCLESLLDSLGAQLDGLLCVAGTESEMQSPFRRSDALKTLEVHDQVPNVLQARQDKRRSHAKIWQLPKRKDFGGFLGVRVTR